MKKIDFELVGTFGDFDNVECTYIETVESTFIFSERPVYGKTTHELKTKNVEDHMNLIAAYIAKIDVEEKYDAVRSGRQTTCILRNVQTPVLKDLYRLGNLKSLVPEGSLITITKPDGARRSVGIEVIGTPEVVVPKYGDYCKNEEINKYAAMFNIDYNDFKKYKIADIISRNLKKFRKNVLEGRMYLDVGKDAIPEYVKPIGIWFKKSHNTMQFVAFIYPGDRTNFKDTHRNITYFLSEDAVNQNTLDAPQPIWHINIDGRLWTQNNAPVEFFNKDVADRAAETIWQTQRKSVEVIKKDK